MSKRRADMNSTKQTARIAGVLYLVSDAAGYVTGQTLNINGGMLMS